MDPVVVLADTRLQVEPGEQVQTTATVRNAGDIVEDYELQVLGEAAAWTDIVPGELSVLPGGEEQVQLVFHPPHDGSAPAGEVPFGFRCVSAVDPDSVAVVEGDLTVGAVLDLAAELVPAARRGRWSGRYRVRLANRGSVPMQLQLTAADPREALEYAITPSLLEVPAGGQAEAQLRVRARAPFLRGQLQRHDFQVPYRRLTADPGPGDGAGAGQLAGVFEQLPIISKGLLALAVLAVVGAVGLFLLLRPKPGAPGGGLPPATPTLGSVEPVGSDRVELRWDADPNVTGYKVLQVRRPTRDTVDVLDVKEVPKEKNVFAFEGLAPGRRHCFQLAAVNEAGDSDPTDPACARTLQAAPFAPPSGVQATPGAGEIRVAWTPSDEEAKHTVLLDGTMAGEAPAGSAKAAVKAEPGDHCVSVIAIKGDAATKPSEEQCVTVTEAAGGGTETGGGTPTTGGNTGTTGGNTGTTGGNTGTTGGNQGTPPVTGPPPKLPFVILGVIDPALGDPAARLQQVQQQAPQARLVDSRQTEFITGNQQLFVIVVDGFQSRAEAQAFCDRTQLEPCQVSLQ